jgi:hypothetical protein
VCGQVQTLGSVSSVSANLPGTYILIRSLARFYRVSVHYIFCVVRVYVQYVFCVVRVLS